MVWIIILLVVVAAFWLGSGALIKAAKTQQDADPDSSLNEWFDGRDQVIVKQSSSTLSADAILSGANERGYRLLSTEKMAYPHNYAQQMIFEKNN